MDREIRVYDLLDRLGIAYERVDHEPAMTMEVCVDIDRVLGVRICKNLFLCNRQKTDFYLLLMPDDKPFRTKELSAQIQSARLSFADADELELASWTTTARLVSEESDAEDVPKVEEPKIEEPKAQAEPVVTPACEVDTYGLAKAEISQIADIFDGRTIDDSAAERINEAFADGFGDIILEFDGEKYTVIDDYREEIRAWLTKIMK